MHSFMKLLSKISIIALIFALVFYFNDRMGLAETDEQLSPTNKNSSILDLLNEYGGHAQIDDSSLTSIACSYQPMQIEHNDIEVEINELLYDGVWLYTSADVSASVPNSSIVMPGSADPSSMIQKATSIPLSSKETTYLASAIQNDKQLLAVYVYPKEFDSMGLYFLDHYQGEDKATVLSGAKINSGKQERTITWSIQVYEVDKSNLKYKLLYELNSAPQQIQPFCTPSMQLYSLDVPGDFPFKYFSLIQTDLATYIFPEWLSPQAEHDTRVELLTKEGTAIPRGLAPDVDAYHITGFPDEFLIELNGDVSSRVCSHKISKKVE